MALTLVQSRARRHQPARGADYAKRADVWLHLRDDCGPGPNSSVLSAFSRHRRALHALTAFVLRLALERRCQSQSHRVGRSCRRADRVGNHREARDVLRNLANCLGHHRKISTSLPVFYAARGKQSRTIRPGRRARVSTSIAVRSNQNSDRTGSDRRSWLGGAQSGSSMRPVSALSFWPIGEQRGSMNDHQNAVKGSDLDG